MHDFNRRQKDNKSKADNRRQKVKTRQIDSRKQAHDRRQMVNGKQADIRRRAHQSVNRGYGNL
jgi:hypothetical protein